jgi:IclR family KDG regulon transcriptional repressor
MELIEPNSGEKPGRRDFVTALQRGLDILTMFDDDNRTVSIAAMARRLEIHRSNASRLAATLHEAGFLTRDLETAAYRLGPELIRLGKTASTAIDLVGLATSELERLVAEYGETGHVGVLDGMTVMTVQVVDGWQTVRMHGEVGRRTPAHASAMGKALLSGLSGDEAGRRTQGKRFQAFTEHTITKRAALLTEIANIRARGFAVDNQELEIGLRCVAAPVFDATGDTVLSIGLSGPTARLDEERGLVVGAAVHAAAAGITAAIGGEVPPPAAAKRA